ncbi:MAG: hypothetical protein M3Q49_18300 [Actinomycetota bacterium]|nr:hypothetical protein [Actinomycetota bacterium]
MRLGIVAGIGTALGLRYWLSAGFRGEVKEGASTLANGDVGGLEGHPFGPLVELRGERFAEGYVAKERGHDRAGRLGTPSYWAVPLRASYCGLGCSR